VSNGNGNKWAGDKECKGEGGKGNSNSNKGGRQRRGQVQQGQWHWQQEWQASGGNGDKEGNGNINKGGRQVRAMATKRAMVMRMRVAGNKEDKGDSSKSYGNCIKGGGQATATRAMAMRVAGKQR
jgi:hypothetical protein